MKSIQSHLQQWMQENKNFQARLNDMKQLILRDPSIKQILAEHPQLTEEDIEKNLIKLYEYQTQSKQCNHCSSLAECQNVLKGYTPKLTVEGQDIHLSYEKCHRKIKNEQQSAQQKLIQSLYVPKEILEAKIGNIYDDPRRSDAVRHLLQFAKQAETKLPSRGIYFYGPFGVGKTYLLGALANQLKELNYSSMIIYMPEFVREMRDALKDDSVNEKINHFKNADILMLDDIGAETQSAWFRDEILGTILQYRMMEGLPVFFSSNFSMEQLEEQLSVTTRGGVEEVKAGRIIERIKQVSKEVPIFSDNFREHN